VFAGSAGRVAPRTPSGGDGMPSLKVSAQLLRATDGALRSNREQNLPEGKAWLAARRESRRAGGLPHRKARLAWKLVQQAVRLSVPARLSESSLWLRPFLPSASLRWRAAFWRAARPVSDRCRRRLEPGCPLVFRVRFWIFWPRLVARMLARPNTGREGVASGFCKAVARGD
jgi:hypothetical protein